MFKKDSVATEGNVYQKGVKKSHRDLNIVESRSSINLMSECVIIVACQRPSDFHGENKGTPSPRHTHTMLLLQTQSETQGVFLTPPPPPSMGDPRVGKSKKGECRAWF